MTDKLELTNLKIKTPIISMEGLSNYNNMLYTNGVHRCYIIYVRYWKGF